MKKLILSSLFLSCFVNVIGMNNDRCAQLMGMVKTMAQVFATDRTTIMDSEFAWRQAYEAYVTDEIIKGEKSADEILSIGEEIRPPADEKWVIWVRRWNDAPLASYFNKAWDNYNGQQRFIEQNWHKICTAMESARDNTAGGE